MTVVKKVLLVDLCGTLVDANTTFGFLEDFLAEDQAYAGFRARYSSYTSRVLNRLLPGDKRRLAAIRLLANRREADLDQAAARYLASVRIIDDVVRRVEDLAKCHDNTLLLSSSLDFIVRAACKQFGFDGWHATTLDYADGYCSGQVVTDLLGRKDRVIRDVYGSTSCTLVTDNRSDANCIRCVDHFVAVGDASDARSLGYWSGKVDDIVAWQQ
ncbi:MAG: HAD family hydrolase [Pseudomonadota bacterium]